MKRVLLVVFIVSLLGTRIGAADEPSIADALTELQSLGEMQPETLSEVAVAETYAELDNLMAKALAFLSRDGAAWQALLELHATAKENAQKWGYLCNALSAVRDCDKARAWEKRLRQVVEYIDAHEHLQAEAASNLKSVMEGREQALLLARIGDSISARATLQDSLSATQEFLARLELIQR